MIISEELLCRNCNGQLIKWGTTNRYVKTRYGRKTKETIQRYRCKNCGGTYQRLPDYILPYKQYEYDIIEGVCEGLITSETKGFEDYPSELTMHRWITSHAVAQYI